MKQRTCATAACWKLASVLAVVALDVLAAGGSIECNGTITTAYDAAGTPRPVCHTPQAAGGGVTASTLLPVAVPNPTLVGAVGNGGSGSGSNRGRDTTYGILIGAALVVAGCVTSLYAHRRRILLGKPFRSRSA